MFAAVALVALSIGFSYNYAKPAYYHQRNDNYYITRGNFIDGTNSPGNSFNTIWFSSNLKKPLVRLDSKNSEIVLNMFRELNRRFKQTIILVTHNPELVTYTDRLIEMRDGVVVSDNDPVSWDTESELAQPAPSV